MSTYIEWSSSVEGYVIRRRFGERYTIDDPDGTYHGIRRYDDGPGETLAHVESRCDLPEEVRGLLRDGAISSEEAEGFLTDWYDEAGGWLACVDERCTVEES